MKIKEKLERRKKLKAAKKTCKQNNHDCGKCKHSINNLDFVGCEYNLR